jgi:DNA mismatch repair ATPase MutS
MQRELEQRLSDARDLRRMMDRGSPQAQDLDQILQQLQRFTTSERYNSPEGIASLKQAIDRLHQVEVDLTRELARLIQSDKYFYAEDSEVPASYKKLVDEYYKALAKGKK